MGYQLKVRIECHELTLEQKISKSYLLLKISDQDWDTIYSIKKSLRPGKLEQKCLRKVRWIL